MALPLHELAALGAATCWATTGVIAADAVRGLGAFHFNLIRQGFVAACLLLVVLATGATQGLTTAFVLALAVSGIVGILALLLPQLHERLTRSQRPAPGSAEHGGGAGPETTAPAPMSP